VTIESSQSGEWLTVKVRYKAPEGDVSQLLTQPVRPGGSTQYLPFASAIAEFGMLLRARTNGPERWDALIRRIDRVQVPASLTAEKASVAELVAIAGSLSRRQ
jgi:Ca-activated chloride channel family protein